MNISSRLIPGFLMAVNLGIGLAATSEPAGGSGRTLETNRFLISGMHCNGCASGLQSELKRTPGVTIATVTLTNQLAVVVRLKDRVSEKQLVKVIEEAGYKAKPQKTR